MGERSNICQNQSRGLRAANCSRSTSAKCSASRVTFSGSSERLTTLPGSSEVRVRLSLAAVGTAQVELVELVAHNLARRSGEWWRVNSSSRNCIQRR